MMATPRSSQLNLLHLIKQFNISHNPIPLILVKHPQMVPIMSKFPTKPWLLGGCSIFRGKGLVISSQLGNKVNSVTRTSHQHWPLAGFYVYRYVLKKPSIPRIKEWVLPLWLEISCYSRNCFSGHPYVPRNGQNYTWFAPPTSGPQSNTRPFWARPPPHHSLILIPSLLTVRLLIIHQFPHQRQLQESAGNQFESIWSSYFWFSAIGDALWCLSAWEVELESKRKLRLV